MRKRPRPLGAKFSNVKATKRETATTTTARTAAATGKGKSLVLELTAAPDKGLDHAGGRFSGDADGFGA